MMGVEKEDWTELIRILKEVEESITALSMVSDPLPELARSRQSIQAFQMTASMMGLGELEKAGMEFEQYLDSEVGSGKNMDAAAAFGFAVSTLADQIQELKDGSGMEVLDINEAMEMIRPQGEPEPPPAPTVARPPEPPPKPVEVVRSKSPDSVSCDAAKPACRFSEMVKKLGGELTLSENGKPGGKFSVTFSGPAEYLENIDNLLGIGGNTSAADALYQDQRIQKMIEMGKEFMTTLSAGNIIGAQEILLGLADQQSKSGLYKEIGGLARGLHDSIRNFIQNLDPSLKEIVEDKIPDSGNRLEHMLELTEKAANTTIDHVETMYERLRTEEKSLTRLGELFGELKPIGDQASKKLNEGGEILGSLGSVLAEHRIDLDIILTAQDYQDLSGQIILKIITLLHDLESKLVNLIRTFGVKMDGGPKAKDDELYGPAHVARTDAVHSQDEVDSLLAEFGF